MALWEHHIARANSAIAKIDAHVSGPREIPPLPKTDAQSGVRRAMQVIEWHRNDYNGAIIDNLLNEIKNATGVELKTA